MPPPLHYTALFQHREINTILADIIEHVAPDRSYEQYYPQLKNVVENIVLNIQDFEALLVMDNFLPLIDLFQQESIRVEVCKKILLGSKSTVHLVNDAVVVNALMFLCTTLHDSVNALTPDDEYRQIGEILCHVIKTIDYGRDFEQQLTFYVEARGMFSNVDIVFVQLVQVSAEIFTDRCDQVVSVRQRPLRQDPTDRQRTPHQENRRLCASVRRLLFHHDSVDQIGEASVALVSAFGAGGAVQSVSRSG
jgi:hypothetical protein